MGKLDAEKNIQRVAGHVVARATFSYQAVNVAGEAGYVAGSGQIREAVSSDRDGALAILPVSTPPIRIEHAEDVPPIPFGATDHG